LTSLNVFETYENLGDSWTWETLSAALETDYEDPWRLLRDTGTFRNRKEEWTFGETVEENMVHRETVGENMDRREIVVRLSERLSENMDHREIV
jgi:hypothetical protein